MKPDTAHSKLSRLRRAGLEPAPVEPRHPEPAGESHPGPADLGRRLAESLAQLLPMWAQARANPSDPFGGGFGGLSANGTVSDRQGGRNLPVFWSEIDLRSFRVLARHLCDTNAFAIGFMSLLKGYHVRKGYGWQACLKGQKKGGYATESGEEAYFKRLLKANPFDYTAQLVFADYVQDRGRDFQAGMIRRNAESRRPWVESLGDATDALTAKAQNILDAWRDANQWPLRSREAFLRWRRDGEVFGRFFANGHGQLSRYRFVEPEQIVSPTGDTNGDGSFGIESEPDDHETALRYHVADIDDATRGEWVDAAKVIHAKANVDSGIKRGVTDFYPLSESLDGSRRLLHTMLATAVKQSRVAWIEKLANAGVAQAISAPEFASTGTNRLQPYQMVDDFTRAVVDQFGRFGVGGQQLSDVRRVEGSRQFEAGPTANPQGYIQVEQAVLRACGVRWNFPEYFSGDASNNNMASSIVAGSPFTVTVEGNQLEFGSCWERPVALKVLEYARDAGLLSWDEWRRLDVETTEPAVATPDPLKDTQVYTSQLTAQIVSLDTVRQKLGYDPRHEAEAVAKDKAAAQPAAMPGAPPPVPGMESRVSESFTGVDANGHHWQDGKQVAAPQDQPAKPPRDEQYQELESHDGGQPLGYALDHDDYTAEFDYAGGDPARAADSFAADFKAALGEMDDYANKAAEYAGAGEAFKTGYAEARADVVEAGETYKDALGAMADAHAELEPHKDELDVLKAASLDTEDYGRPPKKPDDPAKSAKWEQAMAEFQKRKAAAVAKAKEARKAEIDAVRAQMAAPLARYKAARGDAKRAHGDMVKAGSRATALVRRLHPEQESRRRAESFTGIDSHGHHWQNGKQVAAPKETGAKPTKGKKASPADLPALAKLAKDPLADKKHLNALAATAPTPEAKDALETAAWNVPGDKSSLSPEDRRFATVERLASAWAEEVTAGRADSAAHVAGVIARFGGELVGTAGATTRHRPELYGDAKGGPLNLSPGAPVRVVRPAVTAGGSVAIKGHVEPAAKEGRTQEDVGPPPFPGAVFDPAAHRWKNPHTGELHGEPGKPAAPQANSSEGASAELKATAAALVAKSNLPAEQAAEYAGHLAGALHKMPDKARAKALEVLTATKATFHPDLAAVKAAWVAGNGKAAKGDEIAGHVGYVEAPSGRVGRLELHLDGAGAGNTAEGVYAHELGHLLDLDGGMSGDKRLTKDPKWAKAWEAEIKNGTGEKKLTTYARESAAEGFAELARHIAAKGVDDAKKRWPRSVKFLESKGLL